MLLLFWRGLQNSLFWSGVGLDYRQEVHAADSRVREVPEPFGRRSERALLGEGAQGNLAYHGFQQPFRRGARGKVGRFRGSDALQSERSLFMKVAITETLPAGNYDFRIFWLTVNLKNGLIFISEGRNINI